MATPTPPSTVSGPVERAFLLLQHVAAAERPLGVRELGRRAGLPRSTTSRMAGQLVDLGMLTRTPDGDLVVGPAVATLQGTTATTPSLEDQLRPLLLDLVERFGESAALTVDTPGGAHYLAQIPGPSAVQVPDSTGESLPFHTVAPGLVLMAGWDPDRLAVYLTSALAAPTPHTMTDPDALRRRLRTAADQRYAWTDQELDLEVNGVATPVWLDGTIVAAVSLYGPAYRLNPETRPLLGRQLADAVDAGGALALR